MEKAANFRNTVILPGSEIKTVLKSNRYTNSRRSTSVKSYGGCEELAEKYEDDPDKFLNAMCRLQPEAPKDHTTGHVGTLRFDSKKDLNDYLESLGDEITGFYKGRSDNRPYNF
jgi:hypothetical protein